MGLPENAYEFDDSKPTPVIPTKALRYEDYKDGEIVVFENGEYLQVENSDDSFSVLWSSNTEPKSFLKTAMESADVSVQDGKGSIVLYTADGENAIGEDTAAEAIAELDVVDAWNVRWIDLDFEDVRLTWGYKTGRIAVSEVAYCEAGILYRGNATKPDSLLQLVGETATPQLVEHLAEAFSTVRRLQ